MTVNQGQYWEKRVSLKMTSKHKMQKMDLFRYNSCIKFTLCKIYPADHINVIKAYKASEHLAKYTQT